LSLNDKNMTMADRMQNELRLKTLRSQRLSAESNVDIKHSSSRFFERNNERSSTTVHQSNTKLSRGLSANGDPSATCLQEQTSARAGTPGRIDRVISARQLNEFGEVSSIAGSLGAIHKDTAKLISSIQFIRNYKPNLWKLVVQFRVKRHNYKHALYGLRRLYGEKQSNTLPRLKAIQSKINRARKNCIDDFNAELKALRDELQVHMRTVIKVCGKTGQAHGLTSISKLDCGIDTLTQAITRNQISQRQRRAMQKSAAGDSPVTSAAPTVLKPLRGLELPVIDCLSDRHQPDMPFTRTGSKGSTALALAGKLGSPRAQLKPLTKSRQRSKVKQTNYTSIRFLGPTELATVPKPGSERIVSNSSWSQQQSYTSITTSQSGASMRMPSAKSNRLPSLPVSMQLDVHREYIQSKNALMNNTEQSQ